MKTSKHGIGYYSVTGYMGEYLTQYTVMCIGGAWAITRTYGNGPEFYMAYRTKKEAVAAIVGYN